MKRLTFFLGVLLCASVMKAQDLKVIALDAPDKTGGQPLQKVFGNRKSDRAFAPDRV